MAWHGMAWHGMAWHGLPVESQESQESRESERVRKTVEIDVLAGTMVASVAIDIPRAPSRY